MLERIDLAHTVVTYILHWIGHHLGTLQRSRGGYLSASGSTRSSHSRRSSLLMSMIGHALILWLETRVAIHKAAAISGSAARATALTKTLLARHKMWTHLWSQLLMCWRWCSLWTARITGRPIKSQMCVGTLCGLIVQQTAQADIYKVRNLNV